MAVSAGDNGEKGTAIDKLLPILSRMLQMLDNKFIYYFALLNFWMWLLSSIELLVNGLIKLSSTFWLRIGILVFPGFFFNGFMLVCLTSLKHWKRIRQSFARQLPWDLSKMPPMLSNNIKQLCKQIERMFLILYSILLVSGAAALTQQSPGIMAYIYAEIPFMENANTPVYKFLIMLCLVISVGFMHTGILLASYYSFDLIVITRIQISIFIYLLKDFQRNCIKYGNGYVSANLKILIKRHQDILRIHSLAKQGYFVPHLLLTICYCVVLAYSTITIFSPYYGYIQSVMNIMTTVIILFYFSHQCQMFENLNEVVNRLLYDLNWYEWDVNNRKMFLIFFLNSSIKLQHHAGSFVQINHTYFIQSIKILYAMINLTTTVLNRKN